MSDSPASYRDVFAVPDFRHLWAAHVLSVMGDQLARVAITILVYERTRSAGLTALTYALTYLPDFIGGAALAGLADRFPRRAVMVATHLVSAGLAALMAIPGTPLAVPAGLLFLLQLFSAPFSSARQATLADMLTGDRLTLGLGAISITYQMGLVFGLGAGAALVAKVGVSTALLIDAGTFLVSAAIIRWGIGPYRPAPRMSEGRPSGQWETVRAGWAIVARDARLRTLLAIACCSGFYVVPEGLAVPYADQLGTGTAAVGWLLAANPVGTVIGMVVLRGLRPGRRLALLGPMAVGSSAVLVPTGWTPGLAATVALWTLSGVLSAHDIVTQATYVRIVPADRRGQAIGVAIAALRAAQGFGIVVAGLAAQLLAPASVIAVAAVVGALVTSIAAIRWAQAASSTFGAPEASWPRDDTEPG
ncbi:MFS transporter [Actinobacteria bacterium YIM 96077]|uniref:MFS transporter n=1 Tax=Phytoactinopolyspora halophila TaxID=1981511 RepID=A0A329QIX5_9ACTN|nr:MFS transporter [Phytoactinopolyspora halophila]AYY14649.1 MFS transporter [Actinobacteria bacterium YIM 96077]RAW11639.1 MFS transporter [Phytoactinopolyspora halophila]